MINQGLTVQQGITLTSGLISLPTTYTSLPENNKCLGYSTSYILSSSFALSSKDTWTYTNTSLYLSPGTWIVQGNVYINGSTNSNIYSSGTLISTSTTSIDTNAYSCFQYYFNTSGWNNSWINVQIPCVRFINSSTLPITAALWTNVGWTGTSAPIVQSGNTSNTNIVAVRIA